MENEFKTGDELYSGNENVITDLIGDDNPPETVLDVETFDQLSDLISDDVEIDDVAPTETKKPDEPETSAAKPDSDTDSSAYTDIANYFKESGILDDFSTYEDEDFKFDGSEDSFKELMDRNAQRKAFEILEQEIMPQLPPSARKKIELMFENELSPNDAEDIGELISNYSSMTKETFDNDVEVAKKVYSDYLKSRGMDDDEIEEYVQKAVDLEEITEKAEKAKTKLIANAEKEIEARKEKAKLEEKTREQEQLKKLDNIKSSTATFMKAINNGDFKIDEKIAEKIYKSRTEVVAYGKDKQPLNKVGELAARDAEGFQNSLHLLASLDFFKVDKNGNITPNFSKITKSASGQATKKVVTRIDEISKKFTPKGNNAQSHSDDDDDVYNQLKEIIK